MNGFQIIGRPFKIMQTHDPLRLPVPGNLQRSVFLKIDVLDPLGNSLPQKHQTIFFGSLPTTPVFLSAARHNHRCWTVLEQSRQVDRSGDVIKP